MTTPSPVFVGGTGRSGTSMLGRLIGAHPVYHTIPIETRFLVDRGGLCDLVEGSTDLDTFLHLIRGRWWNRTAADGGPRGLHRVLGASTLSDALSLFSAAYIDDPLHAARQLVRDLLDPIASRAGASQWVEMTPPNVARGASLLKLVPDMKLVHIMRDGRDVAASVTSKTWGPSDFITAVSWWADRLAEAHIACASLSPDRHLVVQMEDLVSRERKATLRALQAFLELEPSEEMAEHFEHKVMDSRSRTGRWQHDIEPEQHERVNAAYRSHLERLRLAEVPTPACGPRRPDASPLDR